ncbi:hypothetical protein H0H92_003782 [Tricholoma furcatifolium]|nr:hypothetical protein H0H92_003782 [Tricholoma furcatifolium]
MDSEMPAKKRQRVMDVADGFNVSKPVEPVSRPAVQVPKFASAFDEKSHSASKKPLSKSKFDPRSDFVISKPVSAPSLNKPKSEAKLKQLPIPTLNPTAADKGKNPAHGSRLQDLFNPRSLIKAEPSKQHLERRPPPPPPVLLKPEPDRSGAILKSIPDPAIFVPAETTLDPSLRTISTTDIALATDLFTDNGTAELAHIFLHDQHPEIAASNRPEHPEWNIGMTPQKGSKHNKGKGKDGKFIKGGLAARSSELYAQSRTSLTLWQKETELQLASSSRLMPDLRLRIIKIIELPSGAKSSSPRKPSKASSSTVSTGVALCCILSTPTSHPHLVAIETRTRQKQHHLIVLTFPTVAPPRLRGRDGIYVRNPEDFIAGRELWIWEPWHEVSLLSSHSSPSKVLNDSGFSSIGDNVVNLVAAPFPSLPSSYPLTLSQETAEDCVTADTALLCSRFVIMP